jgi:glycosyltransferase involved in cell wall biosynthesis
VLLLNQYFWPDVAATAQYASELAKRLADQGHLVTALASRRAYDRPGVRFAGSEAYLLSCLLRLAALPRFDVVLAMTSPPLISFLGAVFTRVKGGQLVLWVMDLNPDQAIAAGWLAENCLSGRFLRFLLRASLRQADAIVALDRFMKERLVEKGASAEKVTVLPPWTHDGHVRYDAEGRRAFRAEHGLEGKFVVMYSGNHSPCHPLDAVVEVAAELNRRGGEDAEVRFVFVGGGSEFEKVLGRGLPNVVCLPYQPLERLSASLSAADLHVVVMR